jgi:hypothetical protein
MDLRNVGILLQHYTVSQPRRPRLERDVTFSNTSVHQFCQQRNMEHSSITGLSSLTFCKETYRFIIIHLHLVPRSKNAWSYTSTPPVRFHDMVC